MCEQCYEERYGAPVEYCDLTNYAVSLIQQVYEQPHGGAGGGMHMVIDDFNLDDDIIQCCMDQPGATEVEKELGTVLLRMTGDQRATALAVHDGMIKHAPFTPEDIHPPIDWDHWIGKE